MAGTLMARSSSLRAVLKNLANPQGSRDDVGYADPEFEPNLSVRTKGVAHEDVAGHR